MKRLFFTLFFLISGLLAIGINSPTLQSPSNGAANLAPSLSLVINGVSGATSYDYEYGTDDSFSNSVLVNHTGTSISVHQLLFGQTYYWRARARNATEVSEWSAVRTFSVINTVYLSHPSNGAVDRMPNVALSWNSMTGLTHFDYEYDTVPAFNSPALLSASVTSNFTSVSTANLLFGKTYYWRVRARHALSTSGWSDVRTFTVTNTVYLSNPSNGAVDRMPNVALSWNSMTGLTHFDYEYDTVPAFNSPALLSASVTSNFTSVSTANLLFGKTYYWRVRARHTVSTSGWSDVRSFTVTNTVYLSNPSNGATDRMPNVALSWNSMIGLTHYDYEYDTVPAFNSPALLSASVTSNYTSVSTANLLFGKTYYWRVRARHTVSTSGWSDVRSFTVTNTVYLSNPTNGATDRMPNLALSWNSMTGLTHYDYEYDTVPAFNSPALLSASVTSNYSSVLTANLLFGKTYYWRVRARHTVSTSGWSDVRSFTVINTVYLSNPSNGATDRMPNVTLSWNSMTGLTHYDYEYDTVPAFNSPALLSASVTSNYSSVLTANLLFGKTYYWRVRARHALDNSGWSDVRSFTVIPAVVLSNPAQGASNVSINPTLSWNSISGLTGFLYEYADNPLFDNAVSNTVAGNQTSVGVSGLQYGQTYYWRVKAIHATDQSQWSMVRHFTTSFQLANPPVLSSPANNSQNHFGSVSFSWSSVTGATAYYLEISESNSFTNSLLLTSNELSYSWNEIEMGKTYYWRVRGGNTTGYSPWSAVWSFSSYLPSAPVLVMPLNNAQNQFLSLVLDWNNVMHATSYVLQYSLDADFSTYQEHNLNVSEYQISNLQYQTQYFWRVKVQIDDYSTPWSAVWNFTTKTQPVAPDLSFPLNNSINQAFALSLQWGAVSGSQSYQVHYGTDSQFGSYFTAESTGNALAISGLNDFTEYFWRVRSFDGNDYSSWSDVWAFHTLLAQVQLSAPANNAQELEYESVTLVWNQVSQADEYQYQVSTDNTFSTAFEGTTSNLFLQQENLTPNTWYYWRVKALKDEHYSNWSDSWAFKTKVNTGVEEVKELYRIFPNPAADVLTIELWREEKGKIQIFNMNGVLVKEFETQNIHFQIDVSQWAAGVYILKGSFGYIRFVISR